MNKLKCEKATGGCGVYAQSGGAAGLLWLHILFYSIRDHHDRVERERCRSDLEKKDDTQEFSDYRGLFFSLYQARS